MQLTSHFSASVHMFSFYNTDLEELSSSFLKPQSVYTSYT